MVGLSSKTLYAIAALAQLGKLREGEVMKVKEIAAHADVPPHFLEQILLELKKSGLLESQKGAHGGYRLARPLEKITLKEVVQTLDSEVFNNLYKGSDGALRIFWNDFSLKAQNLFEFPLSILHECQLRANGALDYAI